MATFPASVSIFLGHLAPFGILNRNGLIRLKKTGLGSSLASPFVTLMSEAIWHYLMALVAIASLV